MCAKDDDNADEERDVDAVGGNAAGLSRVLSRDRPRFLDLALASPTVKQSQAGHFATPILHHRPTPSYCAFPPYNQISFQLFYLHCLVVMACVIVYPAQASDKSTASVLSQDDHLSPCSLMTNALHFRRACSSRHYIGYAHVYP